MEVRYCGILFGPHKGDKTFTLTLNLFNSLL